MLTKNIQTDIANTFSPAGRLRIAGRLFPTNSINPKNTKKYVECAMNIISELKKPATRKPITPPPKPIRVGSCALCVEI